MLGCTYFAYGMDMNFSAPEGRVCGRLKNRLQRDQCPIPRTCSFHDRRGPGRWELSEGSRDEEHILDCPGGRRRSHKCPHTKNDIRRQQRRKHQSGADVGEGTSDPGISVAPGIRNR